MVLDANLMVKEGKPRDEAKARFDQGQALAEAQAEAARQAQQAAKEALQARQEQVAP